MTIRALPFRFNPQDPAVLADPYPAYARLRNEGSLCRGGPAQWVVSRHADVAVLLNDPRLGSQPPQAYHNLSAGTGAAGEFVQRIMLYRDRPSHDRLRRLIAQGFTPSAVRGLQPKIAAITDSLLEAGLEEGHMEAVNDLAFPLPVMVICELIGIPAADHEQIRPMAVNLGKAIAATGEPADQAAADAAVTWLRGYIGTLLDQRRRAPRDDLLSRLTAADRNGGGFAYQEIVDNVVFLFFAGFETTTSLIATGCSALLDNPGQMARLWADPSLIPTAIEEFLRFDAPIQSRFRIVREPIEIDGRTLRSGRMLLLLIGSANHDERQFTEPDKLDVSRKPNPHLSFGGGSHYCLGATLARLEAGVVFTTLVQRLRALERAGPSIRGLGGAVRAYARVPMSILPR